MITEALRVDARAQAVRRSLAENEPIHIYAGVRSADGENALWVRSESEGAPQNATDACVVWEIYVNGAIAQGRG